MCALKVLSASVIQKSSFDASSKTTSYISLAATRHQSAKLRDHFNVLQPAGTRFQGPQRGISAGLRNPAAHFRHGTAQFINILPPQ